MHTQDKGQSHLKKVGHSSQGRPGWEAQSRALTCYHPKGRSRLGSGRGAWGSGEDLGSNGLRREGTKLYILLQFSPNLTAIPLDERDQHMFCFLFPCLYPYAVLPALNYVLLRKSEEEAWLETKEIPPLIIPQESGSEFSGSQQETTTPELPWKTLASQLSLWESYQQ